MNRCLSMLFDNLQTDVKILLHGGYRSLDRHNVYKIITFYICMNLSDFHLMYRIRNKYSMKERRWEDVVRTVNDIPVRIDIRRSILYNPTHNRTTPCNYSYNLVQ